MSSTPRTDEIEARYDAGQHGAAGMIVFARELERENAELRNLLNESYQFFRFGHKALNPWGKALDHWCERAERLGFEKEAQS